jgi:hypothetical protein
VCELLSDLNIPATIKSWSVPYHGNFAEVLYEYIKHKDPYNYLYEHTLEIVQSSGTGKSRLIDELSKSYFTIPLNLRDGKSGRFSIRLVYKTRQLKLARQVSPHLILRFANGLEDTILPLRGAAFDLAHLSPPYSRRRWKLLKTRKPKFTMQSQHRPA